MHRPERFRSSCPSRSAGRPRIVIYRILLSPRRISNHPVGLPPYDRDRGEQIPTLPTVGECHQPGVAEAQGNTGLASVVTPDGDLVGRSSLSGIDLDALDTVGDSGRPLDADHRAAGKNVIEEFIVFMVVAVAGAVAAEHAKLPAMGAMTERAKPRCAAGDVARVTPVVVLLNVAGVVADRALLASGGVPNHPIDGTCRDAHAVQQVGALPAVGRTEREGVA